MNCGVHHVDFETWLDQVKAAHHERIGWLPNVRGREARAQMRCDGGDLY